MTIDTKVNKNIKSFRILLIITIIYILFIWIHSAMPADISSEESASVLWFIDAIISFLRIPVELTDHIIRKTAHFCEYTLLGTLVMWLFNRYNDKIAGNLLSCGFICLATSVIDETIQLFSPGRAGMIVDVLLDFSGVISGFVFYILVYYLFRYRRRSKGI